MNQMEHPGRRTFMALADRYSSLESLFQIVPVPYDATSSYVAGSRMGPRAIIDASANIETYDHDLDCEPAEAGIATLEEIPVVVGDPARMVEAVEHAVAGVIGRGGLPVVVGGEHTVSLGAVRALAHKQDFFVVSLDAHADLRDSYQGSKLSHACFLRRASELAGCAAYGVRSVSRDEVEYAARSGTRLFFADGLGRPEADALQLDYIPDTVYLSIDVDVLDPSIMPATGTPEPGGLGWYYLLDLLRRIVSGRRVLGFDVVELCPLAGNPAPDFTAAKLLYKMMGIIIRYSSNREDDRTRYGKEKVRKEAKG
jgi:agmatinase